MGNHRYRESVLVASKIRTLALFWLELNTAINLSAVGDLDGVEKWFRLALSRHDTVRSQMEWARHLNEFAWFLAMKQSSDDSKLKEALTMSEESNRLVRRRNPNYLDTLAECQARHCRVTPMLLSKLRKKHSAF